MDIHVGDTLTMKKPHPCGSRDWLVLRIGADFRLRCTGCGHEVMGPRSKFEKNVRRILRPEVASGTAPDTGANAGAIPAPGAQALPGSNPLSAVEMQPSIRPGPAPEAGT